MKLRSIELGVENPAEAAAFLTDIWGMAEAEVRDGCHYLRGSGPLAYLVALEPAEQPFVRSITFTCSRERLAEIASAAPLDGLAAHTVAIDALWQSVIGARPISTTPPHWPCDFSVFSPSTLSRLVKMIGAVGVPTA